MEERMKLTFWYAPTTDFPAALVFYRDTLGWSEAWREGDDAAAFHTPDSDVQVMVANADEPPGPMFQVDSVKEFLAAHPELTVDSPPTEIPDGWLARILGPGGNLLYVLDQSTASEG
jgi:predicted enzyme related to lactoylglutathione lyase